MTVNLARDPEAGRTLLGVFDTVESATETVSGIVAAGIVPAALEMLDNLMIQAVEQAFGFGFPTEAGAVLIIEVDGIDAGMDREAQAISEIIQTHGGHVQKSITWRTRKEPEYVAIWKSRKSAFGAIGRLSPTFCTQDGVVPRTLLPHILRFIQGVSSRYDIRIANVFHAGDGNIHPILLFDERDPDQVKRVLHASHEILEECIRVGGSVTGEHGIGVEKMALMPKLFSPRTSPPWSRSGTPSTPTAAAAPRRSSPPAAIAWNRPAPATGPRRDARDRTVPNRRSHRGGAGRAGVRHRESLSHAHSGVRPQNARTIARLTGRKSKENKAVGIRFQANKTPDPGNPQVGICGSPGWATTRGDPAHLSP